MEKVKIAVMVSGGGTNLQALIDAQKSGILQSGEIAVVVSNNTKAFALTRAEKAGIPAVALPKKELGQEGFEREVKRIFTEKGIGLIVMAGFMSIVSEDFTRSYPKRIVNVHPSLIPSFCGDGFYGLRVHEAALSYGVKVTGATVHYVNEINDGGEIIAQKAVEIMPDDTPESLQRRVMEEAEWIILPRAVEQICKEMK